MGEWIGYVAATLTTLSFLPQAAKTIRSRDTSGIDRAQLLQLLANALPALTMTASEQDAASLTQIFAGAG